MTLITCDIQGIVSRPRRVPDQRGAVVPMTWQWQPTDPCLVTLTLYSGRGTAETWPTSRADLIAAIRGSGHAGTGNVRFDLQIRHPGTPHLEVTLHSPTEGTFAFVVPEDGTLARFLLDTDRVLPSGSLMESQAVCMAVDAELVPILRAAERGDW